MHDEERVPLRHMIEACEAAIQFVSGRRREDLYTDLMLKFAVVRAVEIVGEAASRISEETRTSHTGIPWKAIVGMRNRLVHAYFDIEANHAARRGEGMDAVRQGCSGSGCAR